MRKIDLIEVMMKRFPNSDPGDIAIWAGMGFNFIMYDAFRRDPSNFDLYAKEFKNVAVLKDLDTDEYYCEYPAQMCQVPDHAEGIRRIRKMKGDDNSFVPVQKDSVPVFNGMIEVYDPSIGYSCAPNKIVWERNPGVEFVRIDEVIAFEEYDMEDPIYIPMGQDDNLMAAIAKFIEGTPPENIKP